MSAEQAMFFLKGFIAGRQPGPPNDEEWVMIATMIISCDTPTKPCGCGGKSHG